MVGEADSVSSLSASACHIGGRTDVNPGEQTLVYGTVLCGNFLTLYKRFPHARIKNQEMIRKYEMEQVYDLFFFRKNLFGVGEILQS